MSSCIYPEDERSETICKAIIETIKEKALLLDKWRAVHEATFPDSTHDIPDSTSMSLTKAVRATVMTDTCNAARLEAELIVEEIRKAVKEKCEQDGIEAPDLIAMTADCHNHMRNVWIGAITKRMSAYLNELLAADLDAIDFRYRVSTMMDAVLRAVDKEFSLPANYPKGHGDFFKHWLKQYHPGALLVPVTRASGSRQDLAVEGAAAVYWNRKYYVEFLDENLRAHGKDNILQENLFIVLTSMEMIALCRVMAVFHFTICMPMRWLAGNTHHLGQTGYNWSSLSMGRAIDALHDAAVEIEKDGSKFLDEDFMNDIFSKLYVDEDGNEGELGPLTDYMTHMFGEFTS